MTKIEKAAYMRAYYQRLKAERPEAYARVRARDNASKRAHYAADLDRSRQYEREKRRRLYALGRIPAGNETRKFRPEDAAAHRTYMRHYNRQKRYGLTPERVAALLERDGNACAICRRDDVRLVLDHDHCTGRERGVLCDACNVALGRSPEVALRHFGIGPAGRLSKAIRYLAERGREGEQVQ